MNNGGIAQLPQAGVKSADRTLDLLECIALCENDLSHSEIAERLSIPKSSLTQLLKNLVARGYVTFAPELRCYRRGPALSNLSRKAEDSRDMLEEARPILADLVRHIGESATLSIRRGWESEVVATWSGTSRLVALLHAGDVAPLYATSGGKALLAFMTDALRTTYFGQVELHAITPNTITKLRVLKKQITAVRQTGFAYVEGEYTRGIVGIATPVLNRKGELLGALSFAVPQIRFNDRLKRDAERQLRQARTMLEKRLEMNPSIETAGETIAG